MAEFKASDMCLRTHSTFLVSSDDISAVEISERLAIEPTDSKVKGDLHRDIIEVEKHGFYLSSKNIVTSNDTNDHLSWLIGKLEGKGEKIVDLRKMGCIINVSCSWWSDGAAGGPVIRPEQMHGLANLDLSVGWLIWFNAK